MEYQLTYQLGGRAWYIYKMVAQEDLHKSLDMLLKVDGVTKVGIEVRHRTGT